MGGGHGLPPDVQAEHTNRKFTLKTIIGWGDDGIQSMSFMGIGPGHQLLFFFTPVYSVTSKLFCLLDRHGVISVASTDKYMHGDNSYEHPWLDIPHRPTHMCLSKHIFRLDVQLRIQIHWIPRPPFAHLLCNATGPLIIPNGDAFFFFLNCLVFKSTQSKTGTTIFHGK